MSENSIEKIFSYLAAKGSPVPAIELVQDVLNLSNVTSLLADNIISSLLKNDPRFERANTGEWKAVRPSLPNKVEWVLCKIMPSAAEWRSISEIHCIRIQNEKLLGSAIVFRDLFNQQTARQILEFFGESSIIIDGIGGQRSSLRQYIYFFAGKSLENKIFSLKDIINILFPGKMCKNECDISSLLGQRAFIRADGGVLFEAFQHQALKIFELLREQGVHSADQLYEFCAIEENDANFKSSTIGTDFPNRVLEKPGVYIMRNGNANVLYVGKAKNLRQRLRSYFSAKSNIDEKLQRIRKDVVDIEVIEVGSEIEALLLENKLIKKYNPPINSQMQVHSRNFLERQRFSQIILLPAVNDEDVTLLFFNPGRATKIYVTPKRRVDQALQKEINKVFFKSVKPTVLEDEEEIIMSWLSKHHEEISRIDMRMVPSFEEALRLTQQHIKNFSATEHSIQI